jgi:hypothetical protein
MFPHPYTTCHHYIRRNEELFRESPLAHYIKGSIQIASPAFPMSDSVAFVRRFLAPLAAVGLIARWSLHLTTS